MSKVAIQGNISGTGTLTIASPNTNTDRTLTLPDSAGTIATAESTLAQFNVTGSAPVFACRAFVNFNGTGTVAIRAGGNVSSITDNGVGDYTMNFTTAMPDANYTAVGMGNNVTNQEITSRHASVAPTTTAFRVRSQSPAAYGDSEFVGVAIFR